MLTKVARNSGMLGLNGNEGPIMVWVLVLVLERKLEEVYDSDFSTITILPEHVSMTDAITT